MKERKKIRPGSAPDSKRARQRILDVMGTRIAQARRLRGFTQAELARRAGLYDNSVVSDMECGQRIPGIYTLLNLADALEVTTDYLFGRRSLDDGPVEVVYKGDRNE